MVSVFIGGRLLITWGTVRLVAVLRKDRMVLVVGSLNIMSIGRKHYNFITSDALLGGSYAGSPKCRDGMCGKPYALTVGQNLL